MKRLVLLTGCSTAFCGCTGDPGINAEALFESRCSVCHSTAIPKSARKSKGQWEETVSRMMHHGAKLSPTEEKALVKYLAKHYRP